jgi:hypothetical protein
MQRSVIPLILLHAARLSAPHTVGPSHSSPTMKAPPPCSPKRRIFSQSEEEKERRGCTRERDGRRREGRYFGLVRSIFTRSVFPVNRGLSPPLYDMWAAR